MKYPGNLQHLMAHPLTVLALQGSRFGLVGLAATATHIAVMVMLVEFFAFRPIMGNFGGFAVAVLVSFAGHFYWTFGAERESNSNSWSRALARFVIVAITGLILNSLTVYTVVDVFALHYFWAVTIMVSIIPLIVFLLSKLWAFA